MRYATIVAFFGLCACALGVAACSGGAGGPAPVALSSPPVASPTPPAGRLYVDHAGILYQYRLPLVPGARPLQTLVEAADRSSPPQLAVNRYGDIAVATQSEIRYFHHPIATLDRSHATTIVPLTPAITQITVGGVADLGDLQYDPNANLWLMSQLGEISMLTSPLFAGEVAGVTVGFGNPGTKSSGWSPLQIRFDVNAALYVYASNDATGATQLFKSSFPYATSPSGIGISVADPDFVDPSQYLPSNPAPNPVLLGGYTGLLASPAPGRSPPPPVLDHLAQVGLPLNPVIGLFPNAITAAQPGALVADPPRTRFYTLDAHTGRLNAYALPLTNGAQPRIELACLAGPVRCAGGIEHLFLAP